MKVTFKTAACLGGIDYTPGTHEVPGDVKDSWFFNALVESGYLITLDEDQKSEESQEIDTVEKSTVKRTYKKRAHQ